jgi:hypothetical protein
MAGGRIERSWPGWTGRTSRPPPSTRLAGGKCQTGLAIDVHELLWRRLLSAALEAPMRGAIRRTGFAGAGEAAVQPTTTHYGSTHHLSSTGGAESGHGPHVAHGDER